MLAVASSALEDARTHEADGQLPPTPVCIGIGDPNLAQGDRLPQTGTHRAAQRELVIVRWSSTGSPAGDPVLRGPRWARERLSGRLGPRCRARGSRTWRGRG